MDRRTRWVLLAYRLPREPSTPRIAVWRHLRRLGVAEIADGVVALPLDARTRERLDWLAEKVVENGGEATVWLAEPESAAQERALAAQMAATVAADYSRVIDEASAGAHEPEPARRRTLARLRREVRRIGSRDYFPGPIAERARAAVETLGDSLAAEFLFVDDPAEVPADATAFDMRGARCRITRPTSAMNAATRPMCVSWPRPSCPRSPRSGPGTPAGDSIAGPPTPRARWRADATSEAR
jgi:hypothetical protein